MDAIEAVDSGSMIIVKQGTYNENLNCHTNKHLHIHADDSEGSVIIGSRLLSFDGTVMMSGFVLQSQCTIDEGMIVFVKCQTGEIKMKARNALHAYFQDCELGAIEFNGSAYSRGGLQNSLALERCEISRHGIGIAVSGKFASVRMHKCRVHSCQTAISFKDQSKGWVADCEIARSETGVEILSDSSVTFQSCKIADNAGDAVVLMGYGLARFESCQIINNGAIAFDIGPGNVEIDRCSVNNNGRVAAFVDAHSVGSLSECDLRHNKAPIAITPGAQVQQSNNLL
ncbi:MAG: right-handed parallel beta-helix repeat-containing protein [Planctomycetaceae bacterium]